MAIKDDLPYLGEIQEDGSVKIGGQLKIDISDWFQIRPDYKTFKSNPYQAEDTCVGVLTGLSFFEDAVSQVAEIKQITIEEEIKKKNYDFLEHPKVIECDTISSIKDEIVKMIKHGKAFNRFENEHVGYDNSSKAFKSNLRFNGLQFLKWAKICNFKIPPELKFGEDDNGDLCWIEENSSAVVENTENDLELQLDQELQKICPEVERFHSALIEEIDLIGNHDSMTGIEQDELKNIACEYFENNQNDYKILTLQYVEHENIYKNVQRRRRKIIGTILQKYLKTNLPSVINHKKIKTSIESLHNKHNSITK